MILTTKFDIHELVHCENDKRLFTVKRIQQSYDMLRYWVETQYGDFAGWVREQDLEKVSNKETGMNADQINHELKKYMGQEGVLVQVDKDLYTVKNVSYNNVSARPILVAGDKVSIPTKKYGDEIKLRDVKVNDVIRDGSKCGFTSMVVIDIRGDEIHMERPYYLNGKLQSERITTWKSEAIYTYLGNQ